MSKRGRNGKGGPDSTKIPFHNLLVSNLVAGALGVLVQPSAGLSPRILQESDAWAHFRMRKLSFRLHPLNAVTNLQAVGYIGGVQDTAPTSISQVCELLPSTPLGGRTTCPSDWVHVPKQDLAGPFPWYKSVPGTADPTEEAPGSIIVAGSTTDAFQLEIRGVIEFKTSVATANTPLEMKELARIREERIRLARERQRDVLLKVLATPKP